MKTLTVKELQVIAKSEGIALSYTKDGKRHKLNKAELIEAIEAVQVVEKVEATDVQLVTTVTDENLQYELETYWNVMSDSCSMTTDEMVDAIKEYEAELLTKRKRTITTNLITAQTYKSNAVVVYGENIKLNHTSNADQDLNLNTVVKDSKRLLQLGLVDKVKAHISILNNKIKLEKKNKLLVNNMSKIRNVLTALLKQVNKKVVAHA